MVPHAAFSEITGGLKQKVKIPVVATNRINDPAVAEKIIANGEADLISMARPFLADAHFVKKAGEGNATRINPCIGCNQACLDNIFQNKLASCLVNPIACEEHEWKETFAKKPSAVKNIAIIGGGPAGLNAALVLLRLGHTVSLFEKNSVLGGQFQLAGLIPGKKDYLRSIDHWVSEIKRLGGSIQAGRAFDITQASAFDHVVLASGVVPRDPKIPGGNLPHVYAYDRYLREKIAPAESVAVIGAGGIGIDVATAVFNFSSNADENSKTFFKHWGIDPSQKAGLVPGFRAEKSPIKLTLLQRKKAPMGSTLGKTTGWIHRAELKHQGVEYLNDLTYEEITPEGVWVKFSNQERRLIPAKQVVVCAGQLSENSLAAELTAKSIAHTVIGGARVAGELDAVKAIREAYALAKTFAN